MIETNPEEVVEKANIEDVPFALNIFMCSMITPIVEWKVFRGILDLDVEGETDDYLMELSDRLPQQN